MHTCALSCHRWSHDTDTPVTQMPHDTIGPSTAILVVIDYPLDQVGLPPIWPLVVTMIFNPTYNKWYIAVYGNKPYVTACIGYVSLTDYVSTDLAM